MHLRVMDEVCFCEMFCDTDGELYMQRTKDGRVIVIKRNYTKKLNPIYVESVDASLLYINEIAQEQELPIQCKMGKEWTDFEKIYTKEAVLNESLFLRFMQKSIVRSGSDF